MKPFTSHLKFPSLHFTSISPNLSLTRTCLRFLSATSPGLDPELSPLSSGQGLAPAVAWGWGSVWGREMRDGANLWLLLGTILSICSRSPACQHLVSHLQQPTISPASRTPLQRGRAAKRALSHTPRSRFRRQPQQRGFPQIGMPHRPLLLAFRLKLIFYFLELWI